MARYLYPKTENADGSVSHFAPVLIADEPTEADWQDFAKWKAGLAQWQPIETAPEDERILIAATPDWVEVAYRNDEEEGPVWYWASGVRLHKNFKPVRWIPLPKFPTLKDAS